MIFAMTDQRPQTQRDGIRRNLFRIDNQRSSEATFPDKQEADGSGGSGLQDHIRAERQIGAQTLGRGCSGKPRRLISVLVPPACPQ